MSRTYRKTSRRNHSSRNWRSRHMAQFDHKKAEYVKPYLVPRNLYEMVTETYETAYQSYCPVELRTYVPQGTPHAIEELGTIIAWSWVGSEFIPRREPSKWYLVPPNETKTRIVRKYVGPNPEYEDYDWYERWQREHLFNFVRKNDTGSRKYKTTRDFERRQKSRKARHEAKQFIKNYIHEDHVADEPVYDWGDLYDDYDPCDFYDDCHDEDYDDDRMDDYDFDYSDSWNDWGIEDDDFMLDPWETDFIPRNHNLRTISEDSGESLGDILEAMIQKEKYLNGELNEPTE